MNELSNKNIIEKSKEILEKAKDFGINLKLIGGIAFWIACPNSRELYSNFNRTINDIDFVSVNKYRVKIHKLFTDYFGYFYDYDFESIPSSNRAKYYDKFHLKICEINYDFLEYSHKIDIRESIKNDKINTISLNDLLLSKLQIHQINSKDLLDIIVLLLEYDLGKEYHQISLDKISHLCSKNWGLEHTIRKNCQIIFLHLTKYLHNDIIKRKIIVSKILEIIETLNTTKKTINWKIRCHFKEQFRWYNEVE